MKRLSILVITLGVLMSGCNIKGGNKGSGENPENGFAVYLTSDSFRENVYDYEMNQEWKYKGTKPAIVDFYADWCAPCRELSPLLEEVAAEYGDKIILYKVDTDKERKLAEKLGIMALPTLLYIPLEGRPEVRMGFVSKDSLKQTIDRILLNRK
jgi:thioredoxin 1